MFRIVDDLVEITSNNPRSWFSMEDITGMSQVSLELLSFINYIISIYRDRQKICNPWTWYFTSDDLLRFVEGRHRHGSLSNEDYTTIIILWVVWTKENYGHKLFITWLRLFFLTWVSKIALKPTLFTFSQFTKSWCLSFSLMLLAFQNVGLST